MLVRTTPQNLAGYFASYHAYPYYPDFIGLDSAYGAARSAIGLSHYFGYLRALKRHHAGRPLLVAEFGVPSSRGTSHLQPEGMHHGGHDEQAMAALDARLAREIREAGAAGGILFSWLDEWFKHTWVTIDLELPPERTRLWHNVMNAEQNYGLLGEYAGAAGATPEPGGPPDRWRELTPYARNGSLVLRVGANPSYLYVALEGGRPVAAARYVVGIDTYRPDRGQFRLPRLPSVTSEVGFEFALVLDDTSDAQLLVAPRYNPYLVHRAELGPTGLDRLYNQAATVDARRQDGTFDSLFVTTNRWRIGRDGRPYPPPTWEIAAWHERLKPAYAAMRDAWGAKWALASGGAARFWCSRPPARSPRSYPRPTRHSAAGTTGRRAPPSSACWRGTPSTCARSIAWRSWIVGTASWRARSRGSRACAGSSRGTRTSRCRRPRYSRGAATRGRRRRCTTPCWRAHRGGRTRWPAARARARGAGTSTVPSICGARRSSGFPPIPSS